MRTKIRHTLDQTSIELAGEIKFRTANDRNGALEEIRWSGTYAVRWGLLYKNY